MHRSSVAASAARSVAASGVAACALVASVLAGCAPALSTFQPAHVAPAGHVQLGGGLEGAIPTGAILSGLDTAKNLGQRAQNGERLTDAQKFQILDAGLNLVVNSPSIGPHLGIAYTVVDRVEANARFAGRALRLGGRYQILKRDAGPFDMTVGLGVARFSANLPLSDQIPVLQLDDFTRWQVDVPLLIGTSHDFYRVWVGPRLMMTWIDTQLTLRIPNDVSVARFDGMVTYLGGQGGFALGYRKVFFAVELTIADSFGTAHTTVTGFSPPTHDTRVSSLIVYPSVGIMLEL
jgi:hypothetical protein